jgi:hypothetical protein
MNKICRTVVTLAMSGFALVAQERPAVPDVPQPLEQPPNRPGLEIFAEWMEADLKTKSILYSNNVVAIDQPQRVGELPTILRCRVLTRTNDGRYDIIIAEGDVEIDQGDIHARGQLARYTSETERLELTGPFRDSPLPLLYSTQGTNANSTVITNAGDRIVYDRRNGKLTIDKPRTFVPSSTLSRGTNSGALFDLKPRQDSTSGASNAPAAPPVRTNRPPFSTSPSAPPPRRNTDRKGAF